MMNHLIILKLGGSLITNKDRPLSPNIRAMRVVGRTISAFLRRNSCAKLILKQARAPYPQYYASKIHARTQTTNISTEGVAKKSEAMIHLDSIVLRDFVREGVRCRTITASEILHGSERTVCRFASRELSSLLRIGCVPITFGDIITKPEGSSIISGDSIALALARKLDVERVVFAMDVDGIYSNPHLKGAVVTELNTQRGIMGKERRFDVTGGIEFKIKVGFELARLGTDAFFVNGKNANRLESVLSGDQDALSTKILSKNISTSL